MSSRCQQLLWTAVFFGLMALIPLLVQAGPLLSLAIMTGYYMLLAASWNFLAGFIGQFSFAHMGLAGVGGYTAALSTFYLDVSPVWTFPMAGLAAAVAGLLLGVVSLRVKGISLPLITFGFAGAFKVWTAAARDLTHGKNGLFSDMLFPASSQSAYLWLVIGLCFLFFVLQSLILTSRWGLYMTAVHDDEAIAEGIGIKTTRIKLAVFTYTSLWAGIAGSLFASYQGLVSPVMMHLSEMGLLVVMVVLGGMGRPFAAISGAIVIQIINYWTRGIGGEYTLLIVALICLPVVFFARDGISGLVGELVRRITGSKTHRWADENHAKAIEDSDQQEGSRHSPAT